jgi:tetratricopeptide (TPR) repeat protein
MRNLILLILLSFSLLIAAGNDGSNAYQSYQNGNMPESLRWYQRALKEAKTSDNLELQAKYNLNIAQILRRTGQTEKSSEYQANALRIFQNLKLQSGIAFCMLEKGKLLAVKDSADSAISYFGQSNLIFGQLKMKHEIMVVTNEIALILIKKGNYKEARDSLEHLLKINSSKKYYKSAAANANNVGKAYLLENNFPQATQWFLRSLEFYNKTDCMDGRNIVLVNLAYAYARQGDCPQSQFYFGRAESLELPPALSVEIDQIRSLCKESNP